jgi:hypothetical protein
MASMASGNAGPLSGSGTSIMVPALPSSFYAYIKRNVPATSLRYLLPLPHGPSIRERGQLCAPPATRMHLRLQKLLQIRV